MIHRLCKRFVGFSTQALIWRSSMPLCMCSMTQKYSPMVSDPRKHRSIRKCGFWEPDIERKLKEIKAADKVPKIRHWGELQQTGKNERRKQAANICGCACTREWPLWATLSFYSCTDTTFYTLQQILKETWPSTQGCQTILAKKHNGSKDSKVWHWDTASSTNGRTWKIYFYVRCSSSF